MKQLGKPYVKYRWEKRKRVKYYRMRLGHGFYVEVLAEDVMCSSTHEGPTSWISTWMGIRRSMREAVDTHNYKVDTDWFYKRYNEKI